MYVDIHTQSNNKMTVYGGALAAPAAVKQKMRVNSQKQQEQQLQCLTLKHCLKYIFVHTLLRII